MTRREQIGACNLYLGDCREVLATLPAASVQAKRTATGRFRPGVHAYRDPKRHWSKDWLEQEYLGQGRSTGDIAAEIGISDAAVLFWLRKHGIPRRTVSEARAVKHWGATGSSNPMHGRIGPANPNYVDGSSPERQRLYVRGIGRAFLRQILARDDHRCQRCAAPKAGHKSLHIHHIKAWAGNPDFRFDPTNAITLCAGCHRFVHSKTNVGREFLP